MRDVFSQAPLYIFLKEFTLKYSDLEEWTLQFQTLHSSDIIFHKTCGPWRLGADVRVVFLPAEPWLTLRKVSRDPFSMNSVMIITGLPTKTHDKIVVSEPGLQERKTKTIKRWWQRSSEVCSCGQAFSLSLWGITWHVVISHTDSF